MREWRPNDGPQTDFLAAPEREVLYGGAAGGGKSDGLLVAAVTYSKSPYMRSIIFRRTFTEMKDLMRRSLFIYPSLGGRFRESTKEWFFPNGGIMEFGYLDKPKDTAKYQGRAFTFIGWDELTHWATDSEYTYLLTRLRATKQARKEIRLMCRATTNPGGKGHHWVKKRFAIGDDGGATREFDPKGWWWRRFIPARISDNPYLAGTDYEDNLNAQAEHVIKMLKEGRWDIFEGAMFTEWDFRVHTCDPFPLDGATLWRGADDGFNAPACVLWFAKKDNRIYVVGELYQNQLTAPMLAEKVLARDKMLPVGTRDTGGPVPEIVYNTEVLLGTIDSAAFNEHGEGPTKGTGRAQQMNQLGCKWRPSPKGPNSRVAGCHLVHQLLQKRLPDGLPGIQIFRNCRNLIRTLPALPIDGNNMEDVDTDAEDHAYDALRYGLQHRITLVKQRKLGGAG